MKSKKLLLFSITSLLVILLAWLIFPQYFSNTIVSGRYENEDNHLTLIINDDHSFRLIPGIISMSYTGVVKREGRKLILVSSGKDDYLIKEGDILVEFEVMSQNQFKVKQSSLSLMQDMINSKISRRE